MSLLGSFIGAVASGITKNVPIVGDIVGGITDAYGQRETNQANLNAIKEVNRGQMELAQYQYAKNLEQWYRENEYNSPYEQMRRLEIAGLNPYLMYTQGSTGQAGASPQYEAPNLQAYHQDTSPLSVLGQHISETAVDTYLKQQMQKEQIKSMQYDNALKEANTEKIVREQGLVTLKKLMASQDIKIKRVAAKYYEAFQLSQLGNMEAQFQNTLASTSKMNEELTNIQADTRVKEAMADLTAEQKKAVAASIAETQARIKEIMANVNATNQQAKLYEVQLLLQNEELRWRKLNGWASDSYIGIARSFATNPQYAIKAFENVCTAVGVKPELGKAFAKIGISTLPVIGPVFSSWRAFSTPSIKSRVGLFINNKK